MIFKYEKKAYNKYQNLVQVTPKNPLCTCQKYLIMQYVILLIKFGMYLHVLQFMKFVFKFSLL